MSKFRLIRTTEFAKCTVVTGKDGTDVPLVSSWPLISEDRAPADCADCGADTRAIAESYMSTLDLQTRSPAYRS